MFVAFPEPRFFTFPTPEPVAPQSKKVLGISCVMVVLGLLHKEKKSVFSLPCSSNAAFLACPLLFMHRIVPYAARCQLPRAVGGEKEGG